VGGDPPRHGRGWVTDVTSVLLLSGGVDSACIAAWKRPDHCLGIDYGQKASAAEQRSAAAIAAHLGLPFTHIRVDASAVGGGLMSQQPSTTRGAAPEWWPYRNQLLITVAAAWAIAHVHDEVVVGTVAGDGDRHADGRQEFYDAMNALLQAQEGGLSVSVPAIGLSTSELIAISAVDDATLGWTHSCHTGDVPCARCPGCTKRADVLLHAGRLQ
jgi:7-cyano-7-deazaguanine synthase